MHLKTMSVVRTRRESAMDTTNRDVQQISDPARDSCSYANCEDLRAQNTIVVGTGGNSTTSVIYPKLVSRTPSANSRTMSRKRHRETKSLDLEAKLKRLTETFECPVCLDYILPPIYQCKGGHLICSQCRPKLTNCPKCRQPLGNIRNLGMEQIADNLVFPCHYSEFGCSVRIGPQEKPHHERTCEFRPYSCPCPGVCPWKGQLEEILMHIRRDHPNITALNGTDIIFLAIDIHLPAATDWVMLQSCFGHHFMLVLEKHATYGGDDQFFAIVQFLGPQHEAERFTYRLELQANRRHLSWEANPHSSQDGIITAINEKDCLIFDATTARLFANNGNLGINVTISEAV